MPWKNSTTMDQKIEFICEWLTLCNSFEISRPTVYKLIGRYEKHGIERLRERSKSPSAFDMKSQQRKLNRFVKEYNYERPHEALDMETPGLTHQFSTKPFPEKIKSYDYPSHMKVMNVTPNGNVRWKSYFWVYMTRGLIGSQVAAEELGNGIWKVFYRNIFLSYFNEKDLRKEQQSTRLSSKLV